MRGRITAEQHRYLLNPIKSTRIAKRSQGGKQLSYLESWDVRAHLIRIFGFGNFDANIVGVQPVYQRDIEVGNEKKPGWEVAYLVEFALTIFDPDGRQVCQFTEAAVGSASGASGLGDLHDNAVKQGASDALKRCAINLGTQFGLSLYNNGVTHDVVRTTLVTPDTDESDEAQEGTGDDLTPEQEKTLAAALGARPLPEEPTGGGQDVSDTEFAKKINTPEETERALERMGKR